MIPYLAGAGVAKLGVADPDVVEASNLHRQVMHREADAGTSKAASAVRYVSGCSGGGGGRGGGSGCAGGVVDPRPHPRSAS